MEIRCELCGEPVVVAEDLAEGQHVLCPCCGGKFSYAAKKSNEITREDLAKALAQCRKNPKDNQYYSAAPAGARLYIALIFYGRVFKDSLNKDKYMEALTAIEPDLKRWDLKYLIAHEDSKDLIAYFKGLLENCGGDDTEDAELASSNWDHKKTCRFEPEGRQPNPVVSAFERRQEEAHERKLRTEDMIREREWRRKVMGQATITACFVSVALVGWTLFSSWQKQREEGRRQQEADRVAGIEHARIESERQKAAAEKSAKEKAANAAREELEREKQRVEAECEKAQTELKVAEQKKAEDVRKQAEDAKRRIRQHYDEVRNSFCDDELVFVEDVPSSRRPGNCAGKFVCAIPETVEAFAIYEMEFSGNGEPKILKLTPDAEPTVVDWNDIKQLIAREGCLYSDGDRSYFQSRAEKVLDEYPVPAENSTIAPGALVLGSVFPLVRMLGIDGCGISFGVRLEKARGFEQEIATLSIDDAVGREPFYQAVEQVLLDQKLKRIDGTGIGIRKPKITVKLYDGEIIKKAIGGITYVPRRPPFSEEELNDSLYIHTSYYRSRWNSGSRCNCSRCKRARKARKAKEEWERLTDVAERQQADLEAYEQQVGSKVEELRSKVKVLPREVESVLKRASMKFFRAKKALVK